MATILDGLWVVCLFIRHFHQKTWSLANVSLTSVGLRSGRNSKTRSGSTVARSLSPVLNFRLVQMLQRWPVVALSSLARYSWLPSQSRHTSRRSPWVTWAGVRLPFSDVGERRSDHSSAHMAACSGWVISRQFTPGRTVRVEQTGQR
ncbi:hypothetical protein ASC63_00005 [Leifsonia sp. Root112D2]|nr:hypothetical protein ASC63_00005 [Leifsonia sp. Root112D2]